MHVTRCRVCARMTVEVPESSHLDTLIRCLGAEIDGPLPQLAYEMGHWGLLQKQRRQRTSSVTDGARGARAHRTS